MTIADPWGHQGAAQAQRPECLPQSSLEAQCEGFLLKKRATSLANALLPTLLQQTEYDLM